MHHRPSPRLHVAGILVFVSLIMSCGPESTEPPPREPSDSDEPIQVVGLTLEDDLGVVVTESDGEVQGEILLLAGETARFSLRVQTRDGDLSGLGAGDSLSVTVATSISENLEIGVHPKGDAVDLSFSGSAGTRDALRIRIIGREGVLYTSAWISVSIEEPAEVHGMELYWYGASVHRQWGDTDSGSLLLERDVVRPVQIAFLDEDGATIPNRRLGRSSRVVLATNPPPVLGAVSDSTEVFSIHLHPMEVGAAQLQVRLVRNEQLVYESRSVAVSVVEALPDWCDVFGPENGPDGAVLDMAVSEGSLIVGGRFRRAGSVVAPGIARWDGQDWHAMGNGLTDVQWVLASEDQLVAGGTAGDFHRWNGSSWVPLAQAPPDVRDAVLYQGELVVRSGGDIFRWTGAQWTSMTPARHSIHMMATHAGDLFIGATRSLGYGTCPIDDYLARYDGQSWERAHDLVCYPCDLCSAGVLYLGSTGESLVLEWTRESGGWSGFSLEIFRAGSWTRLSDALWTRGAAEVGDRLYVVSQDFVYQHEGNAMQKIAQVYGGQLHTAREFQGRLYVCGSFTRIEDAPSFYIGCLESGD
jgi:hypothetical protein